MENIENFYLKLIRVFLVIFATIALIYALINLITSVSDIIDEPELEQVDLPGWSDLRYEILPIKKSSEEKDETIESNPPDKIVDDDILLIFVSCSFCLRLLNAFFRSRFINSLKSSDVMVAFGFQLSRY